MRAAVHTCFSRSFVRPGAAMFQLVVCAGIVSAGMAWAIGAQDVAAMATAVGSKALSVRKAIIVGSICEFIGSLLGGSVCETITSGIAHPDSFASPAIYIKLMFAVLLGSFLWLSAATYAEIPVSTTHSLIGSLIGLSIWLGRGGALNLVTLAWLVGSWIVSPALAAAVSYGSYSLLARFVLRSSAPRAQAMRVLPFIYGATFAIFFVTIAHSVSASSSHAHGGGSGGRSVLVAAAAVCAVTVLALRVSAPLALLASGRASFGQTMNAMSCMLPLIALARRVPFLVPFIGRLNSPHDSPASSAAPEAAALMSASSLSGGDDDKSPASSSSSLGASNAAGSQVGNAAAAAIAPASALAELTHRSGAASAAAGTSLDHGASGDSSDVALMISVRDGDAASSASASLSSPHSVLIDRSEKGGEKRDGLAASSSSSSLLSPTAWSDSAAASHSAAALSAASSAASASAADTVMATSSSSSSECAEAESYFVNLLVLSACAVAVAHGSNDVSNAVAPFAAILKSYQRHLEVAAGTARANSSSALGAGDTPFWVLVAGGLGICIGLASWGWRVMATVGEKITKLTFTRGFVSQMVTATVVLAATLAGLSVSTTQVLVGSITGVALIPEDASASSSAASSASSSASPASSSEAALSTASSVEAAVATTGKGDAASGKGGLNGALVKKIALSWLITMPASALSAIAVYSLLL